MPRVLWGLAVGGVGSVVILVSLFVYGNVSHRPRSVKAQADSRAIAGAISVYVAHCGGLPADGPRADCPVAADEPGGPYFLPRSLLTQQTNARGQIAGPFLSSLLAPPRHWTGAGESYAYYILPGRRALICAHGEGTAANSQGGKSCP